MAFDAMIEVVEEGVVDHPEDGAFLRDEPERDAHVREAVDEVRRSVCVHMG